MELFLRGGIMSFGEVPPYLTHHKFQELLTEAFAFEIFSAT
jgi:hypothetical protein